MLQILFHIFYPFGSTKAGIFLLSSSLFLKMSHWKQEFHSLMYENTITFDLVVFPNSNWRFQSIKYYQCKIWQRNDFNLDCTTLKCQIWVLLFPTKPQIVSVFGYYRISSAYIWYFKNLQNVWWIPENSMLILNMSLEITEMKVFQISCVLSICYFFKH